MASNFAKVFKNLEKQIQLSQNQALNKALTKTKTLYAKLVAEETGLPSKRVKQRAKILKVSNNDTRGTLSIGTKVIFAAHDFKPKIKKVKSRLGTRYGVTIKVGKDARTQLPGAFLAKGKNSGKEIVIQRVGDARYPTKTVLLNVFVKSVEGQAPTLRSFLGNEFRRLLVSQINYNMSK